MISMRLNEAAARALSYTPFAAIAAPEDLDAGELAVRMASGGLARDERGGLFVPGLSFAVPDVFDATAREAQRNCWHLDDHPAVYVEVDDDGQPHINVDDQLHMIKQGILLSRLVLDLAADLPDAPAICCITSTNESNGTFRFHQVRPGDAWLHDDLDRYRTEMIVVVEGLNPAR